MSMFVYKITCPYCGKINEIYASPNDLFEKRVVACSFVKMDGYRGGCRKDFVVAFDVDIRPQVFKMVEVPLQEGML